MSTNIAKDSSTTTSITLHAWYSGSTASSKCKFFMDGSSTEFATDEITGGSTNWTTDSVVASGLSAGSSHSFIAKFYDNSGNLLATTSTFTFYTQLATPTLSVTSSTPTSVTVNIGSVTNGYYYDVNVYDSSYTYLGSKTKIGSGSLTISDSDISSIEPDSSYYFNVTARPYSNYPTSATSSYVSGSTVDPTPGTPTNNSNTPGNGQVVVTWNRPSSYSYLDGYIFFHKLSSSGTWIQDSTVYDTSTTVTATYSGLTNGLSYDFRCQAFAYEGGSYYYSPYSATVTATPASSRPALFDWTYAGWDASTGAAVAGTSKSSSYNLYVTAAEWNALIDNLQGVYTYKGGGSTGINHVTAGNNMLASQFNAVKNAINAYTSTGLADKTNISDILSADFNTLRTKLNAIT